MNIRLSISGNNDSLNIIKLCILYFDNITIEVPKYIYCEATDKNSLLFCVNSFFDDNLMNQINYLISNQIVLEDNVDLDKISAKLLSKEFSTDFDELANKILFENIYNIFDNIKVKNNSVIYNDNTIIIPNDINEIMNNISTEHIDKYFKTYPISENCSEKLRKIYYCNLIIQNLLSSIFYNIFKGRISISNSQTVNELLCKYHNNDKISPSINESINLNNISLFLPNLSNASFDDILEIKNEAKDELEEFRQYIDILNHANGNTQSEYEIKKIKYDIDNSIKNFEYKIKDIKINVVQKFFMEIKNPSSYAPLLGTLFGNVPAYISLLVSIGLISTNVGLEYIKQLNNIKKDNMYFLFKIRKML